MSNSLIDLHTHTSYSDGELTPDELIELAVSKNIKILGITDHNTLDGLKNINRNNPFITNNDIRVIDGIELTAKVDKGTMHILGYDIDKDNPLLNEKMLEMKDNSINFILYIIEQIKRDYGIYFSYNDIKELVNANHNLGRPDIAKLLIKNGYAISVEDAFKRYLISANDKVRGIKKSLTYEECIDLIKDSGGIPVLAHPKTLKLTDKELLILLKEMINLGLKGIEVYHSSHTKEEVDYYLGIANGYDLLISGGSDFHGKNVKTDVELGSGKNNNIKIKSLSILEHIKQIR